MTIPVDAAVSSLPRERVAPWRALLQAMRPHQWVKNLLVFVALLFSRSIANPRSLGLAVAAFAAFCLAASGIYLLNDVCDVEQDRHHPDKRLRPIARGDLGIGAALLAGLLLTIAGLAIGFAARPSLGVLLGVYLILHVGYSLGLKQVAILDVLLIGCGFVLRAVGGAVAIGVDATPWLILCTLLSALTLGFGKRRQELVQLAGQDNDTRASLHDYSVRSIDSMMAISAGAAIVAYALYTLAEQTVQRFGTSGLVLTTPAVIFGILRYVFLVQERGAGIDPARLLVSDRALLINAIIWVLLVALIVYTGPQWLPW